MIRASALYISLIVSILIVLVCGSILMIGYTYKMQERKQLRAGTLKDNLSSAMLVLMQADFKVDTLQTESLFGNGRDSVKLEKRQWGLYQLGLAKSWIEKDSLQKAFLIGTVLTDTLKVLFLADEDRPMSISGKSLIKGTAYLPKAGIKAAYVSSSGYDDKILVHGAIKDSQRNLPGADAGLLKNLQKLQELEAGPDRLPDTLSNSFFLPVKHYYLPGTQGLLSGAKAKGNVIISSDSMIVVDAQCRLDQVILIAPYVKIERDFKGKLQVIATDSISLGSRVRLDYPSALLVLKPDSAKYQAKITIGSQSVVEGQVFAYEKERTLLMPLIEVGQEALIRGEIWSKGYVALSKSSRVYGSVSAIRLMTKVASAIYENYMIDAKLDKTMLSRYYLSSMLLNSNTKGGRLLCWVN